MGLLQDISRLVYREYDRRIKRASVITEYGQHHHGHGHGDAKHAAHDHAEQAHAVHEPAGESEGEAAEIVNVPRGTPVAAHKHVPNKVGEPS